MSDYGNAILAAINGITNGLVEGMKFKEERDLKRKELSIKEEHNTQLAQYQTALLANKESELENKTAMKRLELNIESMKDTALSEKRRAQIDYDINQGFYKSEAIIKENDARKDKLAAELDIAEPNHKVYLQNEINKINETNSNIRNAASELMMKYKQNKEVEGKESPTTMIEPGLDVTSRKITSFEDAKNAISMVGDLSQAEVLSKNVDSMNLSKRERQDLAAILAQRLAAISGSGMAFKTGFLGHPTATDEYAAAVSRVRSKSKPKSSLANNSDNEGE